MAVGFVQFLCAVAAVMVVAVPSVRADCGATVNRLTWSCGETCGQGAACVAYDASAACSSCVVADMGQCQYLCLDPAATTLELANSAIAAVDVNLTAVFPTLERLELSGNGITSIGANVSSASLVELGLSSNSIATFDAQLPALTILNLANNSLTAIPPSIFAMESLSSLILAGNPLANRSVSDAQANFLANRSLDLSDSDFMTAIDCGGLGVRRQIRPGLALCVSEMAAATTVAPTLTPSVGPPNESEASAHATSEGRISSRVGLTIGLACGGALLVLALVGTALRCRQRRGHDKGLALATMAPDMALLATPMAPQHTLTSSLWGDRHLCFLRVHEGDIRDMRELGRSSGGGVVWLVRYQHSELLASKRLVVGANGEGREEDAARLACFVREVKLAALLDHPSVVLFAGVAWTSHRDVQALFEYMELGSLREQLAATAGARAGVWDAQTLRLAVDVAEALAYAHAFAPPMVHRDVKSRHVLLAEAPGGAVCAKLKGFGRQLEPEAVATGRWIAPEVLVGILEYSPSADVFSFGVLLSELDTHAAPYDDVRAGRSRRPGGTKLSDVALLELVMTGELRPSFGPRCPAAVVALAGRCMAQDPSDRPAAGDVLAELRRISSLGGAATTD